MSHFEENEQTRIFKENRQKVFTERLNAIIKLYKENKKFRQEDLAASIPVQRETVSRWINGRNCPLDDELTMKGLAKFFNVSPRYFLGAEGLTRVDPEIHEEFEEAREAQAAQIGLSLPFVEFVKNTPALADAVMKASWIYTDHQSISPDVPDTGNLFLFVSSSGTKVYPSVDALFMLRVVQRDLEEYAAFLIEKYTRWIEDAHKQASADAIRVTSSGSYFKTSGKSFSSASSRFWRELRGMGSLSPEEARLVDSFRDADENGQREFMIQAAHATTKRRKKERETK